MVSSVLEKRVEKTEGRLDRIEAYLERSVAENRRNEARVWEAIERNAEKNRLGIVELQASQAETDKRIKETDRQIKELNFQTSLQIKELGSQIKETGKQINKFNKQMGEMAHKMGTLAEDLIIPSLPRIMEELIGCPKNKQARHLGRMLVRHPEDSSKQMEIDGLVSCDEYVLINETKSTMRPEYVPEFIGKLAQFREFLPEYTDKKLIGVMSSLHIDTSLVRNLSKNGLVALAIGDSLVEMLNGNDFQWQSY